MGCVKVSESLKGYWNELLRTYMDRIRNYHETDLPPGKSRLALILFGEYEFPEKLTRDKNRVPELMDSFNVNPETGYLLRNLAVAYFLADAEGRKAINSHLEEKYGLSAAAIDGIEADINTNGFEHVFDLDFISLPSIYRQMEAIGITATYRELEIMNLEKRMEKTAGPEPTDEEKIELIYQTTILMRPRDALARELGMKPTKLRNYEFQRSLYEGLSKKTGFSEPELFQIWKDRKTRLTAKTEVAKKFLGERKSREELMQSYGMHGFSLDLWTHTPAVIKKLPYEAGLGKMLDLADLLMDRRWETIIRDYMKTEEIQRRLETL